jgi:ABC-type transporter Mla MlaB component
MSAPTVAFTITGPIARSDLEGLCKRVCALFERSAARVALCDVSGVEPDAVTVDALARLQVAANRRGCRVHLRNASVALTELVAFMGLEDVLVEARRQPEEREERRRVEEEGEL